MASKVKFQVHSGTSETKNIAPLWKLVEARKMAATNDLAKGLFSRSAQNNAHQIRTTWKTRSALASSQFKMTVLPIVTTFLYRLRTQTIIKQKVY